MPPRRCLGCNRRIARGSRCRDCRREQKAVYASPAYQEMRVQVLIRDNWTCQKCGRYGNTVDHKIPASKGGPTTMDNMETLCRPCNSGKRDR